MMTLPIVLAISGCIALLVGLFGGGVKAKEIEVPRISALPRISSGIFGIALIGIAIWLSLAPNVPSQEPIATLTSIPPFITNIPLAPSMTAEAASLISWAIDPTGVCRDDAGGYPRWSEYTWSFSQCQEACKSNPNCQGFAMSKQKGYCQLFGSDGGYEGNDPANPDTQISHGDSSESQYTCYIKQH
jgi:hypothetical protein